MAGWTVYSPMGVSTPTTITLAIGGPITRADLPGLCERVCALLEESDATVVICDVSGVDPDAVTVDALARVQVAARRHGCQVRLRRASAELLELVEFMGLRDVLPDCPRGPSTT
jgi:ABC-type transporter Mla MlaB component